MEEDHAPFAEKIVNMLANDEDQGGRKLLLLVMKLHLHYLPHEKYETYLSICYLIGNAVKNKLSDEQRKSFMHSYSASHGVESIPDVEAHEIFVFLKRSCVKEIKEVTYNEIGFFITTNEAKFLIPHYQMGLFVQRAAQRDLDGFDGKDELIGLLSKDQTMATLLFDCLKEDPIAQWYFLCYISRGDRNSWGFTDAHTKNPVDLPLETWQILFRRGIFHPRGDAHEENPLSVDHDVFFEMIPFKDLAQLMKNQDFKNDSLILISFNKPLIQSLVPYLMFTDLEKIFEVHNFHAVVSILQVLHPRALTSEDMETLLRISTYCYRHSSISSHGLMSDHQFIKLNKKYFEFIKANKYYVIFEEIGKVFNDTEISAIKYLEWLRIQDSEKDEERDLTLLDRFFIFLRTASAYPEMRPYFYKRFSENDQKLLRARLEPSSLRDLCLTAAATHPTGAFSYMPESFPETLKNEVSGSEKFIDSFLQEIFPMGEDYAFFAEEIVNMLANNGAQGGRKLFNLVNRFNELGPQHEKYRFIYILFYHLIWEAMNTELSEKQHQIFMDLYRNQ